MLMATEGEKAALRRLASEMEGAREMGMLLGYGEATWKPGVRWLPAGVIRKLAVVVRMMASADAVQLVARDSEMTVQEAAEFLGIPHPAMLALLEAGAVVAVDVASQGAAVRVRLVDVVALRDRLADEAAERGRPGLLAGRAAFLAEAAKGRPESGG